MNRLPYIHPGEILLEEFLKPMKLSQTALAKADYDLEEAHRKLEAA